MANLKVSCIDRHDCNTLLIKAVIAPVMQSGYEDEKSRGLDEYGPRGPAAQPGLHQSLVFLSLAEGHQGTIGNCLLSAERARKFINTLLFILKILQKTERLLKSSNDGFIDFPAVHQHSCDHAVPPPCFLGYLGMKSFPGSSCNSELMRKTPLCSHQGCE